ncbi:MAG: MBL fold metallo-hydrolase, partial [Candidatus Thorarchaeota archaeon]|nr:MBL fold metallo-hydrolase [Candidatus Thorarchaeota archaeon]
MKLGAIEITPLASESMGVRSLCTHVKTPDISLLLDPSAALAFRPPYDPHPEEYRALEEALGRIREFAELSNFISLSHSHYDHVRSGLLNRHYSFSSRD